MIAYKIQSEMLIADGWLTKEDVSMQLEDMQNYPVILILFFFSL